MSKSVGAVDPRGSGARDKGVDGAANVETGWLSRCSKNV